MENISFKVTTPYRIGTISNNVESVGVGRESQLSSKESNFGLYHLNNPFHL